MELKEQVCSLNLALLLKELGVKQESVFQWLQYPETRKGLPDEWEVTYGNQPKGNPLWVSAFTVAELGEMLPTRIDEKVINAAYPMPKFKGHEKGEEWDQIDEAQEAMREKLHDVFSACENDSYDQFQDGQLYDLVLSYGKGKEVMYFQTTDDWEDNCEMISVSGDTEADARAKMLVYLLENKLITV